jgi:outer membrane protein assembly factor BamE (lipoprotein component of BamABCDE complex)
MEDTVIDSSRRFLVMALFVMLSGCGPVVSSDSSYKRTGEYVGRSSYAQIRPGKSSDDFVVATLGEPTSKSTLEDGSEIWQWTATGRKSGSGSVLFLYSGSNDKEIETRTFVKIKDGRVTKKLRE